MSDSLLPVDKSGDHYIGGEPDDESEDAVVLCYIRMTVKP